MSKFLKAVSVAGLALAATSVFAGGVEPGPMMDDPAGLFVGVGGGYTSMNANSSSVSVTGGTFNSFEASTDGLAPFGQIGYWGHLDDNWMWGVKGFYKYTNASANYNLAIDNVDTVVSQEAGALVMAGMHWNKTLAYVGVGPVWMPVQSRINDFLTNNGNPTAYNSQVGAWGAVLGLGVRYDINPNWFTDAEYSYAFTSNKTFSRTVGATTWSRTVRVHMQQFDLSVNYRFAI